MAHYFFHLHDRAGRLEDEDGVDYADVDHAVAAALDAARDVMAADVRAGVLHLDCWIEITDGHGASVKDVPFREALAISGLPGGE